MSDTNFSDPLDAEASPMQYDRMLVAFHWLLALGLLAQLGLGLWMEDLPKEPVGVRAQWFNLHKSIGLCLGLAVLWRLGWRVTHSVPAPVDPLGSWSQRLADAAHKAMYLCMLLMPISGFFGIEFFGLSSEVFWMGLAPAL